MLKIKEGVRLAGLDPVLINAMQLCEIVYRRNGHDCTVTSACEGKHRALKSKHYCGHAIDLRTRDLPSDEIKQKIVADLKVELSGFTVLLEADHIHVEWDPVYEGTVQS